MFISYAHLDDVELIEGRQGWVTNLHRTLCIRLGQLQGRESRVWWDPKLQGNDVFESTLVERLRQVAAFVAVVSPRYVRSEWARRELAAFCEAADSQGSIREARIFKVLKTPVPLEQQPAELQSILGYEFFKVDPETGRARELNEIFGPEAQRDFWLKLDDLAHDICLLLRKAEPALAQQRQTEQAAPPPKDTRARRIFLCYRRGDSGTIVGRIYDRLERDFGKNNIFKDVDSIPFGVDFVERLDQEVEKCHVLFAVIGQHWLTSGPRGAAQLDDPNDFVRIEIASALRRTIPVVPVLVDGARMPLENQLPDEIKALARRQGTEVRHDPDFHGDMTRLLSRIG